jgi:hypothetical protein
LHQNVGLTGKRLRYRGRNEPPFYGRRDASVIGLKEQPIDYHNMPEVKLVRDDLFAYRVNTIGKGSLRLMERSSGRRHQSTRKPVTTWTMGKGGSGPRLRRDERSGYVGPFDHPKKEQKTVESPLQG